MWCVVIMRRMPCTRISFNPDDTQTEIPVDVEDPVAVFGPYSSATAHKVANHFNRDLPDEDREHLVDNAPDFIRQEDWDKHWAVVRPMNVVP